MAEERIICLKIGSHLRNCPLMKDDGYCVLDYGCDQLEGKKCNKGFTRTEAIERMAKAMSDTYFNDVHASEPDMLEKMAEAALDALVDK